MWLDARERAVEIGSHPAYGSACAPPRVMANVIEDDLITCSVCLDVMCDPVTIAPCGHSCCCACIELWLQRNQKCPFCTMPMLHCCLSYSLKSVVERLHGPALTARRSRLGAAERKTFSIALTQSQLRMLPLAQPATRLLAELAVFFPRLANLGWKELAAAWFLLFIACFCAIQWALANELSTLFSDPAAYQAAGWDRLHQYSAALPRLIVQIFLTAFVFFFALFLGLQYLTQRRHDQAAGLR